MTAPQLVPADDSDVASAPSYRNYKNLCICVNRRGGRPRAARRVIGAAAGALIIALAGCRTGGSSGGENGSAAAPPTQPPAAARAPEAALAPEKGVPQSPARAAAAEPGAHSSPALRDLEKRIVPPEPAASKADPRAAAAAEEARLQEEAEQMAHDLVKEIDLEEADKARQRLVTEKDLEAITLEGVRTILAASLVPENRTVLASLIESGHGKEVGINLWVPGRIQRTERGSLYRETVPMMRGATLELDVGGQRATLEVDLISIGGRWKVFKLEPKTEE
jgi:hypothetical protein